MNTYCAVLMDTISIQKYVFGSNMLRDNLGASYIVNQLFNDIALDNLNQVYGLPKEKLKKAMYNWKNKPKEMLMDNDPSIPFEVGVAGGGKALMFFRDSEKANAFIKRFTSDLLTKAPGLQLAVAIEKEFTPDQDFRLKALYQKLTTNRNKYFPVTTFQNHGITAIYPQTGSSFNIVNQSDEKKDYLSLEKSTKLEAADKEEKILNTKMKELYSPYCFTNRIDWLGQTEGNSYIAVVHIDGNNMGKWFQESSSLEDYRRRSRSLEAVTEESFWSLVDKAIPIMKDLTPENGFEIKDHNLPLRPLILGGDDITFICEGRLGLYFTEKFMQIWTEKANAELSKYGNRVFSACAGVAIANTKYPFYRTYSFAEELCASAKRSARAAKKGSWIDFHLISGTKSGILEAIRKDEGIFRGLDLHFGPYCLEDKQEKSLQNLKQGIYEFSKYWSRSHLKELRTAFCSGKEVLDTFLIDMTSKNINLPCKDKKNIYKVDYSIKGYTNNQTPYFDMLEMMEYYPLFLLERGSKNEAGN